MEKKTLWTCILKFLQGILSFFYLTNLTQYYSWYFQVLRHIISLFQKIMKI